MDVLREVHVRNEYLSRYQSRRAFLLDKASSESYRKRIEKELQEIKVYAQQAKEGEQKAKEGEQKALNEVERIRKLASDAGIKLD